MDPGAEYLFVKRSANALTIAEETPDNEFIKVASLRRPERGDHIVVDAVNSAIVNSALDPDNTWTIKYKNIARCVITKDFKEPSVFSKLYRKVFRGNKAPKVPHAKVQIVGDREPAELLALSYDAVSGEDVPVEGLMSFRRLDGHVKVFMQHLLDAHHAGFTHNDMHLGNVMLDKHSDSLKMIDYGRLCFSGLDNPVDGVAQYDRIVDVAGASSSTRVKKHGKWSPWRSDTDSQWSDYYWMTDLVTLSMQLYVAIVWSDTYKESALFQRQCVVPFLGKELNNKKEEYDVATYEDPEHLLELVQKVKPSLYTLLPGLVVYAIILKHIRDDGDELDNRDFNYVFENYVVLHFGGDVLLGLFNGEHGPHFAEYEDVLEYAFGRAGLWIEGQYGGGGPQAGGSGLKRRLEHRATLAADREFTAEELEELEALEDVGMQSPFPCDLVQAANWRYDLSRPMPFASVPDEDPVGTAEGITNRVPAAINMNYVDRPLVAPVSGGGRQATAWLPAVLAAVTVAMAFLQ